MNEQGEKAEMRKVAMITGITGQDGSYLAELLLSKNYEVHGLIRRSSSMCNRKWIDGLDIELHYGDLTDFSSLQRIVNIIMPDEIYHLGAQTHVGISFDNPITTLQINTIGTLNLLEVLRLNPKNIRMYNASTSEMLAQEIEMDDENIYCEISNEETSFEVHSPYAVSKLAAHELCKIYREAYDIFVCNGILFNHESERRGDNFVTQKIVKNLVAMKQGRISSFELGNIEAYRDWGHARDYVEAMWLMLQHDTPDDYVIATNESHSVKEFIEETCKQLNLDPRWMYSIDDQKPFCCLISNNNKTIGSITLGSTEKRPWDVNYLRGDPSKAERVLGWKPKVRFKELIKIMIEAELKK